MKWNDIKAHWVFSLLLAFALWGIVIGVCILWTWYDNTHPDPIDNTKYPLSDDNPRNTLIDTVYIDDSIYFIEKKIDKVLPDTTDNEDGYHNEDNRY